MILHTNKHILGLHCRAFSIQDSTKTSHSKLYTPLWDMRSCRKMHIWDSLSFDHYNMHSHIASKIKLISFIQKLSQAAAHMLHMFLSLRYYTGNTIHHTSCISCFIIIRWNITRGWALNTVHNSYQPFDRHQYVFAFCDPVTFDLSTPKSYHL